MQQLRTQHILLFRILRDHCLFLTRAQIERVLTLATRSTNKELAWLLSEKYLGRRYRADTFGHFQTPVYYLGTLGWHVAGNPMDDYKELWVIKTIRIVLNPVFVKLAPAFSNSK